MKKGGKGGAKGRGSRNSNRSLLLLTSHPAQRLLGPGARSWEGGGRCHSVRLETNPRRPGIGDMGEGRGPVLNPQNSHPIRDRERVSKAVLTLLLDPGMGSDVLSLHCLTEAQPLRGPLNPPGRDTAVTGQVLGKLGPEWCGQTYSV